MKTMLTASIWTEVGNIIETLFMTRQFFLENVKSARGTSIGGAEGAKAPLNVSKKEGNWKLKCWTFHAPKLREFFLSSLPRKYKL